MDTVSSAESFSETVPEVLKYAIEKARDAFETVRSEYLFNNDEERWGEAKLSIAPSALLDTTEGVLLGLNDVVPIVTMASDIYEKHITDAWSSGSRLRFKLKEQSVATNVRKWHWSMSDGTDEHPGVLFEDSYTAIPLATKRRLDNTAAVEPTLLKMMSLLELGHSTNLSQSQQAARTAAQYFLVNAGTMYRLLQNVQEAVSDLESSSTKEALQWFTYIPESSKTPPQVRNLPFQNKVLNTWICLRLSIQSQVDRYVLLQLDRTSTEVTIGNSTSASIPRVPRLHASARLLDLITVGRFYMELSSRNHTFFL